MYARNYGEGEKMQSFRRGEYSIPANYAGNAFTADEPPDLRKNIREAPAKNMRSDEMPEKLSYSGIQEETEIQNTTPAKECISDGCSQTSCNTDCPHCTKDEKKHEHGCANTQITCCDDQKESSRGGILRDLLSRFERGFELDDWLLIGLILLLLHSDKNECDNSRDEIIIILAFLLLSGF